MWRASRRGFLSNHSTQIVALLVVPSVTFELLYVSSLSGWPAEIWSRSMQHLIRPQSGRTSNHGGVSLE
jgi:hypothetical protein